jgi:hypothetical protein
VIALSQRCLGSLALLADCESRRSDKRPRDCAVRLSPYFTKEFGRTLAGPVAPMKPAEEMPEAEVFRYGRQ